MRHLTPEEAGRLWFGDLIGSIFLFERIYFREGLGRSKAPVSRKAARAFARELILAPTLESAREQMRQDPRGAAAFYAEAVRVRSDLTAISLSEVHTASDGKHEPFLLAAAAVLNRLESLRDA